MWSDFFYDTNFATGSCYFHNMKALGSCLFSVQGCGHFPREARVNGFNLNRLSIESASTLSYRQTCTLTGGLYEYIHQLCRPTSKSIPAIQTEYCIPFDLDQRHWEAPSLFIMLVWKVCLQTFIYRRRKQPVSTEFKGIMCGIWWGQKIGVWLMNNN